MGMAYKLDYGLNVDVELLTPQGYIYGLLWTMVFLIKSELLVVLIHYLLDTHNVL